MKLHDINDTLCNEGEDAVRARHDRAQKVTPHLVEPAEGDNAAGALKLTFFDDCTEYVSKRWLIKGVIAFGETSRWIAPPGRGKSAVQSDICVHLGAGINWRGYRTKGRFGTVYFAFERPDLVKR